MKTKTTSLALSFALPFTIMGAAFALNGVFPFGGKLMLNGDNFLQFYPFLSGFWHQIREGSLAPWSWIGGAGHDYTALFAYFLASPLNLLAVLAPYSWLREMVTLLLLVKLGCAGLFAGIYLHSAFHREGEHSRQEGLVWVLPVFACLYALCAFTLGYYQSIPSFDSFALLPLVMLGLLAFIREGRFRLYVLSLALAVFANYLIGFYICIFSAIMFFCQCIIQKINKRDFLRKLGLFSVYSLLAAGMAAVLLFPTWFALSHTSLQDSTFSTEVVMFNSFFDIIGNLIAFQPPTIEHGLPNLYSGMITVMFAGLFIFSTKFSRREKTVLAGSVVFLLVSCNINILEYIWNGFNYFRGLPSRYSFLLSFMLVTMAYRVFISNEISRQGGRRSLLVMGIGAALVLLSAVFGSQEKTAIIGSAVLCGVYLLLLLFRDRVTGRVRQLVTAVFFLVILAELAVSSWIGVRTSGSTNRDEYPYRYEQVQDLLENRKPAAFNFYRTDIDMAQTSNDPFLHHYNGISIYSSTVNVNTAGFIQGLGLLGWDRSYFYRETTPLFNAFLNVRYVIYRGRPRDNGIYWETAGTAGDALLLENKYYLPLGFMVKEDVAGYARNEYSPFLSQNELFSRATGFAGNLFSITNLSGTIPDRTQNVNGDEMLIWNYTMPSDGVLFIHTVCPKAVFLGVFLNDDYIDSIYINGNTSFISAVGSFANGDIVSFVVMEGSDITMYAGCFNTELFEQGYAQLAAQPLVLTEFTETKVSGHVTALEDGLLYTSIPADKNWSVYVDGLKKDIVLVDNAMAAVRLSEGAHEVEFRYFNRSLLAGIIISLVSLAIFIVLLLVNRNKRR